MTEDFRSEPRRVSTKAVIETFFEAQIKDGNLHQALENASYFSEKEAEVHRLADFRKFLRVDEIPSGPDTDLHLKIAVDVIFALAHELASKNLSKEEVRKRAKECASMISGYLGGGEREPV